MNRIVRTHFAAVCLVAVAAAAHAATVVPGAYSYQVAEADTEEVAVCQLVLDMTDDSVGELVRFAAIVGFNRVEAVPFAGFRIGAGDLPGPPDGSSPAMVELASAGFSGEGFNSAGLYQEVDLDNSVWTWAEEPEAAAAFLDAIVAGGFQVILIRAEPNSRIRRYVVAEGPPAGMLMEFMGCIGRLSREDVAAIPTRIDHPPRGDDRALAD